MIYKIIFEERTIFNDEYEELDNCEIIGFLDLHIDEDGYTELSEELSDLVPNSLVIQSSADEAGYTLITNVPENFIESSEPNGNFNAVDEYSEDDYDKAISFIKNLKKIPFDEIELWDDNEQS
tara:strand:- start:172 stop:540 length:369 start_codon:yes stop_codon:yes gene_type:complete